MESTTSTFFSANRPLKDVLRTQCLSDLGKKSKYFHIRHVRDWLKSRQIESGESTLKQYMSELMAGDFIQDAGKGWYSTIVKSFVLDERPVEEVVGLLKGKYPLLRFGCWSTEQIKGYSQHVFNKFVTFVHVGKDACRPVFESLRSGGWNVYTDLGKKEMRTVFSLRDKTVVIRPSRKPASLPENHLFPIEVILIDLYREAKSLSIMDLGEVETICSRAAEGGRINIGKLQMLAGIGKINVELITCLNRLS
jgi:hypothetical protein